MKNTIKHLQNSFILQKHPSVDPIRPINCLIQWLHVHRLHWNKNHEHFTGWLSVFKYINSILVFYLKNDISLTTTMFSLCKQGLRGKPGDAGPRGIQGSPVSIKLPLLTPSFLFRLNTKKTNWWHFVGRFRPTRSYRWDRTSRSTGKILNQIKNNNFEGVQQL